MKSLHLFEFFKEIFQERSQRSARNCLRNFPEIIVKLKKKTPEVFLKNPRVISDETSIDSDELLQGSLN